MISNIFGYDPKTDRDRIYGTDAIISELRQFNRLAPLGLSDADIAHRMALSVGEVKRLRGLIAGGATPLRLLEIRLGVRVMLGNNKIRTLGELFSRTDKELLAIRGLGPKTLQHLKQAACKFMGAE